MPLVQDRRGRVLVMGRATDVYTAAQETAEKYRIAADTVRRKVQSGAWPCDRIGRLYRFSPEQQCEIAQIVAGTKPGGYDEDCIREALLRLSE